MRLWLSVQWAAELLVSLLYKYKAHFVYHNLFFLKKVYFYDSCVFVLFEVWIYSLLSLPEENLADIKTMNGSV